MIRTGTYYYISIHFLCIHTFLCLISCYKHCLYQISFLWLPLHSIEWKIRRLSQPSFGCEYFVPIFSAEESYDDRSRLFVAGRPAMSVAKQLNGWHESRCFQECFNIYIHSVLNNGVHNICALVFFFLFRNALTVEVLTTIVIFKWNDFFPVLQRASV